MRRKRGGIKEIARSLNVSAATVSLALNGKGRVSDAMRKRVAEEAERLGFIPDQNAISLRLGRSRLFGLIVTDLTNTFFAELNADLERVLYEAGYLAVVGNSYDSVERQRALVDSMVGLGAAGFVIIPAADTPASAFESVRRLELPYAICVRDIGDQAAPFVGPDDHRAGYLVARYLLSKGHQGLAFVGGHASTLSFQHRINGINDALREASLAPMQMVLAGSPNRQFGHDAVPALMNARQRFTAVLSYNDLVATGIYSGLAKRGLRAGKDLALAGFDNIPEAAGLMPPLTTVDMKPREIGHQAGMLVLDAQLGVRDTKRHYVQPTLIVRASA